MKKIILFALISLFFFSACENILVKTLELEDFDYESQLVITGTLISNDSIFKLLISENRAITEPLYEWEPLEGAIATLYKEESSIGELTYNENSFIEEVWTGNGWGEVSKGLYELELGNLDLSPGKYSIEVSHPNFDMATAESEIPESIPLKEIVFEEDYGISPNNLERSDAILITFDDPIGDNYYKFDTFSDSIRIDTFSFGGDTMFYERKLNLGIDTGEPNAVWAAGGILVNDDLFDEKEHTIVIYVQNYFSEDPVKDILDFVSLSWEVISKDRYDFETSYSRYDDSNDFGPFSEAVSIFNNVEGGLGTFSGTNRSFYKIP